MAVFCLAGLEVLKELIADLKLWVPAVVYALCKQGLHGVVMI